MKSAILGRLATYGMHRGIPALVTQRLARTSFVISQKMLILARYRHGRILLHLLAMLGDRCVRFHVAGITRELPWAAHASALLFQRAPA